MWLNMFIHKLIKIDIITYMHADMYIYIAAGAGPDPGSPPAERVGPARAQAHVRYKVYACMYTQGSGFPEFH